MMSPEPTDEVFTQLEKDYEATKIITVVQREEGPPRVQWDESLTEQEVVANLFKALLFMTLDEYIMEIFDEMSEDDLSDDPDSDDE